MRCNVGIDPKYLADAHLIAEYRELLMVVGSLRVNNWQIKSPIPYKFCLGAGHINFFKDKLIYLKRRHDLIKQEMALRYFKCDTLTFNLYLIPEKKYLNDWQPSIEDSILVRERIKWKLLNKPDYFWKYQRNTIDRFEMPRFIERMMKSELFEV